MKQLKIQISLTSQQLSEAAVLYVKTHHTQRVEGLVTVGVGYETTQGVVSGAVVTFTQQPPAPRDER